jgi:hypothetical protein
MVLKNQRGALSLFWCAVLVGVVSLGAIGALFSMRYERNFFAEAWARATRTPIGQAMQQTRQATENAVRPAPAAVRKCVVDGKVVYSNVECDAGNPTSRKVELYDTRGIEAPKAPPAAMSETDAAADLRNKMIEKAVQR